MNTRETDTLDDAIWILYGSHTGNGERLARFTQKRLAGIGMKVQVCDMAFFEPRNLERIRKLLLIVSTHGIGEPPAAAMDFYEFVMGTADLNLRHMRFAVLALGDTAYEQFCQTGKEFDEALGRLGAMRILERVDLDVDLEIGYLQWIENILKVLPLLS